MEENKLPEQKPKEETYEVHHAPTPHVVHVQKSPFKTILVVLLILVLAGGAGYIGYLYLQEKDNANNLQQQVDTLNSQQSAAEGSDANEAEQTENETVSYTAEVGKFTLTLPEKYRFIEQVDGGAEGGPATSLDIGLKTEEKSVIDNDSRNKLNILATKILGNDTLQDVIDNKLGGSAEGSDVKVESIQISGIKATRYDIPGLGMNIYIFFERDGIIYQIETWDLSDNESEQEKLKDVIAGFKFTE